MKSKKWLLVAVLGVWMALLLSVVASADDLEWNLLTDVDAGYRLVNAHETFEMAAEEDGTVYVHNHTKNTGGAYYIYDDNNILGTYRTFSLEGDFYFDALPHGLRDGKLTPTDAPLSFLCWGYRNVETGKNVFNALRITDDGSLFLPNGTGTKDSGIKLEAGRWYNIRILMTPQNGLSELYLDGEKVADFNIVRFDPKIHVSEFLRYFDGFFKLTVKMKNLIVKTDSDYIIGLRAEAAADYLGCQTSMPTDGFFSLRALLGVNDTAYNRIGYEAILLEKDETGSVSSKALSARAKTVYTSIKANGGECGVWESFGYSYAAALELSGLRVMPEHGYVEIVLRPYVLGMDGLRLYGAATILIYSGETDEEGYPILSRRDERFCTLTPVGDTFIFSGGYTNTNFGDYERMQSKNEDPTNIAPERAAYFKFTLSPEQVKLAETAVSAKFCVYVIKQTEETTPIEMVIHGTSTEWEESTLTYGNHTQLAKTWEEICRVFATHRQYFYVDVLSYINEQMPNEDGSLTLSFRVTPSGGQAPVLAYIESRESSTDTTPYLEIVSTIYDRELNLKKISNVGYEPWGYAEHLVDAWFGDLKDKIFARDENGELIEYAVNEAIPEGYGAPEAIGDFTTEVEWTGNFIWISPQYWHNYPGGVKRAEDWSKARFARTLSTLGTSTANAYLTSEYAVTSEYDVYGGIANAGFKGQATGFFHTEIFGDRTYVIDPIGNPYFAVGMDDVTMLNGEFALDVFGSEEAYYEHVTRELQNMGINTAHVSAQDKLLAVEDGLNLTIGLDAISAYMFSIGRSSIAEGKYPHNNTMNVFDPDFGKLVRKNFGEQITAKGYADNPRVFGYTTDNELPIGEDLLLRYLTVDPAEPTNAFSYAVAWSYLARRMDTPNPTVADYLASPEMTDINSEFLSLIYATYYRICKDAIEAVDTNHMYLGSRSADTKTNPYFLRAAGYYLDIITANLYTGLHYPWEIMVNYYRYAGKPFLVTEFYAKSMDAIDDNGFTLANSTGAGFVTKTQQARADYYEHQAMALLESRACVGWTWYCMLDNDQPLHYSIDLDEEVVMAYVSYGQYSHAESFMNKDGRMYTETEVGFFETIDAGNAMASNHNVNKGVFNRNYSSTVAVYTYGADGTLRSSKSYHVEHPDTQEVADGTVLVALDGSQSFTVGCATNADGSYTETVLTTYRGTYIALAKAMRRISDNLMGLVRYFDAQ